MVESYDLNSLKIKFFQLRSVNATQKLHIFMVSPENGRDYLLMGPFDKISIYPILEELGIKGTVFPNVIDVITNKADRKYLVLEDPTRDYNLYVSQTRTNDNGSIVRINEFKKFTELCESNEQFWLYEDVKEEPGLPGYSPVSLLTTLTCLYILNIAIKADYIYIDTKRKQYHIFDLFEQRNDKEREDFFFVENVPAKCKFYENMSKYFNRVIANIAGVDFRQEIYNSRKLDIIGFLHNYSGNLQPSQPIISTKTSTSRESLCRSKNPFQPVNKPHGKYSIDKQNPVKSITFSGFSLNDALNNFHKSIYRKDNKHALAYSAELYMFHMLKDVQVFDIFIQHVKIIAINRLASDCYLAIQIITALNKHNFHIIQSIVAELCNAENDSYINDQYNEFLKDKEIGADKHLEILDSKPNKLNDSERYPFSNILVNIQNRLMYKHVLSFIVALLHKQSDLFNICFSLYYYWHDTAFNTITILWDILYEYLNKMEGKLTKDDLEILYNDYYNNRPGGQRMRILCLLLTRVYEENQGPKKLLKLETFDDMECYLFDNWKGH